MINKKEISKIAKRIFHSKTGLQNPKIMNPTREWGVGLLVGFIFFVAIAGWSAQTYLSNKNFGDTVSHTAGEEVVVYRESMVEAALQAYELRNQKHQQLLDSSYVPPPVIEEAAEEVTLDETSTSSDDVVEVFEDTPANETEEEFIEVAPEALLLE